MVIAMSNEYDDWPVQQIKQLSRWHADMLTCTYVTLNLITPIAYNCPTALHGFPVWCFNIQLLEYVIPTATAAAAARGCSYIT